VDFNDESYLPYKFVLVLRGSRDGFTPKKFHELCDDKHNTVTFIKVKETEEIIGGYNPIIWKSSDSPEWGKTKDSFIFSFKNKNNSFKDAIISNVVDTEMAIYYDKRYGPCFNDIFTYSSNEDITFEQNFCEQYTYEKEIRDTNEDFSIEDYEVFQITKR
jgi:hypothetical protein